MLLNIESIKESLNSVSFIKDILYLTEVTSTNDYAKSVSEEDIVILTDYQTSGRGRYERIWESERGSNLIFTVKKKLEIPFKNNPSVNFFFSYFLNDCMSVYLNEIVPRSNLNFSVKWPNDILLNGKKISGILIENTNPKNHFIIGFGINVNQETFSDNYDTNATSLKKESGTTIDRNSLFISIIKHFDKNINLLNNGHFDIIYKLWKGAGDLIGKNIIFRTPGDLEKSAKVIDFTEDGGIQIEVNNKKITYYSGDIKIVNSLKNQVK